ncbi:MAG: GNAT family N-acetyltransferase [Candidatus Thiodiazotropha sp. (ex Dulcina madagascariensis)]|nr:GNAT family N-acetyltransferase [Candidatus Thiodiazotropha sp. (ex Epidulcina cf. delphinae)]MCU7923225.1 GNAT family N-acetyltransferase [Candidatus Thiodiazotropha sp. (ex Dulcina madagascariensis)]MCU7929055.1 GNAT family N-acetyltransferase [Candidatus Thiodiazotropha sp. (ex Dulcina madagascariensis)]
MEEQIQHRFAAENGDSSSNEGMARSAAQLDVGPQAVILEGEFARLRPLGQNDYGYLYDLSLSAKNNARWRYRGATPSPERFVADLWSGVLAQFMVETPEPRKRAGLLVAYNADLANGTVYLGVLIDNAHHRKVWPLEGVMLFIDYLFQNWTFRKVYAETTEFSAAHFSSGVKTLFEEEGRFRDHQYFQGRYWDYIYYALTRKRWEEQGHKLLDRIAGLGSPG